MSETPDFDRLTQRMADRLFDSVDGGPAFSMHRGWYIDQLRLVWNARGSADIASIESQLETMMGGPAAGPYCKHLCTRLRTLDQ